MKGGSNQLGILRARITQQLAIRYPNGELGIGCRVGIPGSEIDVDVCWMSSKFLDRYKDSTPFPVAPEVCILLSHDQSKIAMLRSLGARSVSVYQDGQTLDVLKLARPDLS